MIKKIGVTLSIVIAIVIVGCSTVESDSADTTIQVISDNQNIENFLAKSYELKQVEVLCPYNPDPNAKRVKLDSAYEVLILRQYRSTDEYYICNIEVLVKRSGE